MEGASEGRKQKDEGKEGGEGDGEGSEGGIKIKGCGREEGGKVTVYIAQAHSITCRNITCMHAYIHAYIHTYIRTSIIFSCSIKRSILLNMRLGLKSHSTTDLSLK